MYIYVYVVCMMISPDIYACMIYKIFNFYIYIYIIYIFTLCCVYIYTFCLYIYIYMYTYYTYYLLHTMHIYIYFPWLVCVLAGCPMDALSLRWIPLFSQV